MRKTSLGLIPSTRAGYHLLSSGQRASTSWFRLKVEFECDIVCCFSLTDTEMVAHKKSAQDQRCILLFESCRRFARRLAAAGREHAPHDPPAESAGAPRAQLPGFFFCPEASFRLLLVVLLVPTACIILLYSAPREEREIFY